jgi:hypothetical protein
MEGMLDGVGLWKERKERNGRKMEGMLDGVGLWKERKKWEEDGRNVGRSSVVVKGRVGGRIRKD